VATLVQGKQKEEHLALEGGRMREETEGRKDEVQGMKPKALSEHRAAMALKGVYI